MSDIQRWDMNHVQGEVYIDKKPEGSWVTYADHLAAVAAAEQRVLDEERTKEKWFCSEEDKQALIAHGVQAARDAVDGTLDVPHRSVQYVDAIVDAVAAIDGLTNGKKEA